MKQIVLSITFLFCTLFINAQKATYTSFYNANKSNSQFTMSVPVSLANFLSEDQDTEELDILVRKAKNCKVMVFTNKENITEKRFKHYVKSNAIKTLVKVKDGDSKASVYFKEDDDLIKEIIIKANSDSDKMVIVGLSISLTKDEFASVVSSIKKDM